MVTLDDLTAFFELSEKQSKFQATLGNSGGYIKFKNSGIRGDIKEFTLSLESIKQGIIDILHNKSKLEDISFYKEEVWRNFGKNNFSDLSIKSSIEVQTKPTFTTLSKVICWANNLPYQNDESINLEENYLTNTKNKLQELIDTFRPQKPKKKSNIYLKKHSLHPIHKPFILLAGISGTGKTRFVREQAKRHGSLSDIYQLVSVRPDWHEPADLLGYISRMSGTPEYVVTDVLRFIVKAWLAIAPKVEHEQDQPVWIVDNVDNIPPFWLCLDEMNLAPVEQYFADYLSVLETREWLTTREGQYRYACDPLLKPNIITSLCHDHSSQEKFAKNLGLDINNKQHIELFNHFCNYGIPIPFNLIVAGTVNMDETTHSFSRKVIDRALSIDFGDFFPNEFDHFFHPISIPITFTYPLKTHTTDEDFQSEFLYTAKSESIRFLKTINQVFENTPFKLAYRALNELLLAVANTRFDSDDHTSNEILLEALWDDFIMMKVLPRIEGDTDKLTQIPAQHGEPTTTLAALQHVLSLELKNIWNDSPLRPDLFRLNVESIGSEKSIESIKIKCRSKAKLMWMEQKLTLAGFTQFWP